MVNANTMEAISALKLPSCYVGVSNEEVEYLDGGFLWGKLIGWICNGVGAGLGVAGAAVAMAEGNKNAVGGLAIAGTVIGFIGSIFTGVKFTK